METGVQADAHAEKTEGEDDGKGGSDIGIGNQNFESLAYHSGSPLLPDNSLRCFFTNGNMRRYLLTITGLAVY